MTWPFTSGAVEAGAHRPVLQGGNGTRRTMNWMGYSVSATSQGASFDHPWRPGLSGSAVILRAGTVSSFGGDGVYIPKIRVGGRLVPMSGDDRSGVPRLSLDASVANAAGESWVVLEVVPTAGGELTKESRIEIVHTRTPLSHARTLGRQPLVMILWRDGRAVRAMALTHFNLRYFRAVDEVGARHFFL